MANHVSHFITVNTVSPDLRSKLLELFKKELHDIDTSDLINYFYGEQFTDESLNYETAYTYVGAKWVFGMYSGEDDDSMYFTFTAAWEFARPLMHQFYKWCAAIDPDCTINCTFEDEGLNFAGVYVAGNGYECDEWLDTDDYNFEDPDSYESYTNDLYDLLSNEIENRDSNENE